MSRKNFEISEKAPEISDFSDYEPITAIKEAAKTRKIFVIIIWNLCNQESEQYFFRALSFFDLKFFLTPVKSNSHDPREVEPP